MITEEHGGTVLAWIGNGLSVGAIVSALAGFIPSAAALVALSWYLIQIYESETVQQWLAARRLRKIARLRARIVMLEAQILAVPPPVIDKKN